MTVSNGDIVRLVASAYGPDNQVLENVWFFKLDLDSDMSDPSFIANADIQIKNIYSTMNAYFSNQVTPRTLKWDKVAFTGGKIVSTAPIGESTWPSGFSPADTSDPLPAGVAPLVKYTTSAVKTLGRKFLWAIGEANWNGDIISANLITAATNAFGAMLNNIVMAAGKNLQMVVHSKRANDWVFPQAMIIPTVPAYQRRRRPGRGV